MSEVKVTIGLMVYNEEKYIRKTLDKLISHDFGRLPIEIIIGDNASTDKSSQIIEKYAKNDNRIKYIKRSKNLGAIKNFSNIISKARGEYFILAGGHDLWSDNYIKELASALDKDNEAVIAYSPTKWIDDNGHVLNRKTGFVDTSGKNTVSRFSICLLSDQHAIYGLIRMSAIRQVRVGVPVFISAAILLAELSLLGTFIVVPNAVWYRRENRKTETRNERISRYEKILFEKEKKLTMPHWFIPWYYFKVVWISDQNIFVKTKLFFSCFNVVILYSNTMITELFEFLKIKKIWKTLKGL